MTHIERCGRARVLAAFIACLASSVAFGQSVNVYGASRTSQDIQAGMMNGTLWPAVAAADPTLQDCDKSRLIATGPKRRYPASERHEAALRFQDCIAQVRGTVLAASGANAGAFALSLQVAEERAAAEVEESAAETQFMGMSFGVGVGVSFSEDDIVSEAEVAADDTIRATKTETQEPRVILESHYYGWCKTPACNEGSFGIGPFFGIVAKDDKLISAFAVGLMVGWKDKKRTDSDGFSVGVGLILDSDVSSLADGFDEGEPLPEGETEPQFEEKSRWGALLFFTRTF